MNGSNTQWFDDYADDEEDQQIDEYDITSSPNDFNVRFLWGNCGCLTEYSESHV